MGSGQYRIGGGMPGQGPEIQVDTAFLILMGAAFAFGQGMRLLSLLFILAVHEAGHLWIARALRLPLTSLRVTPFGAIIRTDSLIVLDIFEEITLSLAGPAASGLLALGAMIARRSPLLSYLSVTDEFIILCLGMGAVNLFPALPLDGGRAACRVLGRFLGARPAAAVCGILGYMAAAGIAGYGVYLWVRGAFNPFPLAAGGYLAWAVWESWQSEQFRCMRALYGKESRFLRMGAMPVRRIRVLHNLPVGKVIRSFTGDGYHEVVVVDRRGKTLGVLGEDTLVRQAVERGMDVTVGSFIRERGI
jgi:stage IV sporulation protein FB